MLARYALADASCYAPLLYFKNSDGTHRYPLYDGTGTARGTVNQAGTPQFSWDLDAFGRYLSPYGDSTWFPYRFGGAWGYESDPSGLLQLGARWYWPEIGRFISQDPIGDGMNWYAYAGNNPVVGVDPEGLQRRRRRGFGQWLRGQRRAVEDAISGLGHMAVEPFSMDPANLPTFAQRNPGLGDLQNCIGRGQGFDPTQAFGELANIGINAGVAAFGGMVTEGAGSLRFTPEQSYLIDLAQLYKKTGITAGEAEALLQLAEEAGIRPVLNHIEPPYHWVKGPHIHIGPIPYIPIK